MVYFIVTIQRDRERDCSDYEDYIRRVKPIVERYGGRYLIRSDKVEALQEQWQPDRVIVIAWDTKEQMETPGHSDGSLSWLWDEQRILFCGDAIPALDDVPIFTDLVKSQESIKKIMTRADIRTLCPAWDRQYEEWEWKEICQTQLELLERLRQCEAQIRNRQEKLSQKEMIHCIIKQMGWEAEEANPLLRRSIQSCLI